MLQLIFTILLSWLAFYWLPTIPAVIATVALFALFTGRLNNAAKRGRRILAQRRKDAEAKGEPVPPRPQGKYAQFLALFYWRESMIHAMMLGMMAGGAFGGFMGNGGDGASGMAEGSGAEMGGFGDFGGGDFGGGGAM